MRISVSPPSIGTIAIRFISAAQRQSGSSVEPASSRRSNFDMTPHPRWKAYVLSASVASEIQLDFRRFSPPWSIDSLRRDRAPGRSSLMSISRMSPAGARRRTCSPARRPGGSPPGLYYPDLPQQLRQLAHVYGDALGLVIDLSVHLLIPVAISPRPGKRWLGK